MRHVSSKQEQATPTHPKETEHNVTEPLELVYTDIVGPIYPESLGNFLYIHKFSDQHTKHFAVYYSKNKNDAVRLLKIP